MSKPAKQALVAELLAVLAPLLTPAPLLLPKSIAHAVDELAESILRWQARQVRPTRLASSYRTEASPSDALTRLMDTCLHEEVEGLPSQSNLPDEEAITPTPLASQTPMTDVKKRRPRLSIGKE